MITEQLFELYSDIIPDSMIVEHEAWALLILKPTTGHDAEPVCSTLILLLLVLLLLSTFQEVYLSKNLYFFHIWSVLSLNIIRQYVEVCHDPFLLSLCTKSYASATESLFLLVGRYSGCHFNKHSSLVETAKHSKTHAWPIITSPKDIFSNKC
jgi:hypothetical protein